VSSEAPTTPASSPDTPAPWELGIFGIIGMLIGVLMVLIGLLGLVNAALGLELAVGVAGAHVRLPRFLNEAWPVPVIGLAIVGLSAGGSYLLHVLKRTQSWALRIGLVVAVLAVVSGVGWWGIGAYQASMYGSRAAAHAANGSVDALVAELDAGVSDEVLDDCMFRAIQFGQSQAVAALLAHGAEPIGRLDDGETWCRLEDAEQEVLDVAAEHGWSSDCRRLEGGATASPPPEPRR